CRVLADESEQHLLQEQTDQAGAVLTVSIAQVQAPLEGAVRAAAATNGDPTTFARVAAPLLTKEGGYRSVTLYRPSSPQPRAQLGDAPRLGAGGESAVQDVLARTAEHDVVIVDLLQPTRTLGYAVRDTDAAGFVVYGERQLSPDPNVRRRTDEPFSQV